GSPRVTGPCTTSRQGAQRWWTLVPDADPLAAALDDIRIRHELAGDATDMPKLINAVAALLELAGAWKQEAATLDDKADREKDSIRSVHLFMRAQGCEDHALALREAIYRAFRGEA